MGLSQSSSIHHKLLGNVTLNADSGRPILQTDVIVLDQYEAKRFNQGVAMARQFDNRFLFLPISSNFSKGVGYVCGQSGTMKLMYEDFRATLNCDINDRALHENYYSEQEILRMLFILAKSAKDFQHEGMKLGNIHPESILMSGIGSHNLSDVRIVNRYSWPNEPIGVQKILENAKGSYISPQQMRELERKRIFEQESEHNCSDSFSIGMTILEMGTLISSENLYDVVKYRIDIGPRFQARIAEFNNRYPSAMFLQKILGKLLQLDPQGRPLPGQIHALLKPYEREILGLKEFRIDKQVIQSSVKQYNQIRTMGKG